MILEGDALARIFMLISHRDWNFFKIIMIRFSNLISSLRDILIVAWYYLPYINWKEFILCEKKFLGSLELLLSA